MRDVTHLLPTPIRIGSALASAKRLLLFTVLFAAVAAIQDAPGADYIGSVSVADPNPSTQSAATDILGNGGGAGWFSYKGGGNAIDAAVAAALAACVVNPANCSLGGYGGHMLIWKAGWDGEPPLVTCIDFNSAAGSLATSNMFVASVNPTNGQWTGAQPNTQRLGWKAVGVPGTFAGLFMAQTNYGRKMDGTNYFPFAEILKPSLARVANGQATGNAYYSLTSVSNLLMELYTNSPGYLDDDGHPNPNSSHDPYGAFYSGGIALDIVAAMQAAGGLVTYADLTNYKPREVTPYMRHFNCPNGTPATVCVAPPGSAGVSVLQQLAVMEALGWTNGPDGTWDTMRFWHSRAEAARLMWKDHYQWLGDPWSGVLPPDFLGNGSTNFSDQFLAHATKGYPHGCSWDTNEVRLTNSLAGAIAQAVNNQTNLSISVDWDDIRYGTCNISTSDKWGNCVAVTLSMGGGFGAQVAVTNRGLVLGQGMALFDPRPGWPDSIAPGKRPVNNMAPAIVIPDQPVSSTNGMGGGRPPFAVGGVGGSTIENNMAMQLAKYLMDPPSSTVTDPTVWLYNFEGNQSVYMRPSYPAGVQSYLAGVGFSAPGGPPSVGRLSYVEAWIAPVIVASPASTNLVAGNSATFDVTATGLPLFYQWLKDGVALTDGGPISGARTARLTVSSVTSGGIYAVLVTNGAGMVLSAPAALMVDGAPLIVAQPLSRTNVAGTLATFSVTAIGSAPLTYQWLKHGTNLANDGHIWGATTSQLSVSSVSNIDAASYSVIVSNSVASATSLGARLTVINSSTTLSLLWSVSPSAGVPWMTLPPTLTQYVPNQRSIAYHALSNQLYVVSRSSSTTSNYVIYVLNATNGTLLYTLKTNGIQSAVGKGGIGLVGIGVADDGAIYACNEAPDAAGGGGSDPASYFRVYRWANAHSNTSPSLIFLGDPSGSSSPRRWGDNLAVRGAGPNTQLLVDMTYFGSVPGTNGFAGILFPSNQFLTNFSARWFSSTNIADTVGRSLEFDLANNAIWQKGPGKALFKTNFDPAVGLGGTRISAANVLVASNFPAGLMGLGLDLVRNLAAGVVSNSNSSADSLNLYDISDLHSPVLLAAYDFPTNPQAANANRISQTFFRNDLLFSLDANNGLMVFRIQQPGPPIVVLTNFAKLANGLFQFGYASSDSRAWTVFASTNLSDWNSIGTATQSSPGWFQFTDPAAADSTQRFYQLRAQ